MYLEDYKDVGTLRDCILLWWHVTLLRDAYVPTPAGNYDDGDDVKT